MGCLCDTCFEIDKRKCRSGLQCKNKNCDGWIVEIDELFLPAISLLNKKGYYTRNCCSGHMWDKVICRAYIQFEGTPNLPCLPEGFVLEKYYEDLDAYSICNRININQIDEERHRDILYCSLNLMNWAIKLPTIKK
jgi:hypothetical protein